MLQSSATLAFSPATAPFNTEQRGEVASAIAKKQRWGRWRQHEGVWSGHVAYPAGEMEEEEEEERCFGAEGVSSPAPL